LGKEDNCQIGMYLGYSTQKGHTLVDRAIYMPKEWCEDPAKRLKCHVPEGVKFRPSWEVGTDLIAQHGRELPHRWIVGDEEFGKSGDCRERLRIQGETYVLTIGSNRLIRPIDERLPKHVRKKGGAKKPAFRQVQKWAAALPANRFRSVWIRDGEKAEIEVLALIVRVQTKHKARVGPTENLLVTKQRGVSPDWHFWLTNDTGSALEDLVRVAAARQTIEQDFERAKGDVGMADYEVRSWVGWHHHMTLVLMALFFLVLEQRRLGKKLQR
jgi:SRSO17 transposase